MELQKAIGTRRSFRYLDPDRPVEIEKIQMMLEAARLASHFGNNNAARALVVHRATATQEQMDCLPSPVGGFQIQLAPVVILWYVETNAMDNASDRLRELVACGALGYGEGRFEELEQTLVPVFTKGAEPMKQPGLVDQRAEVVFRQVEADHELGHEHRREFFARVDPVIGLGRAGPAEFVRRGGHAQLPDIHRHA